MCCALFLSACGAKSDAPLPAVAAPAGSANPSPKSEQPNDQLAAENARLRAEVAELKAKVEDLAQTPQVLLTRVQALVKTEKLNEASALAESLETRYGQTPQSKAARNEVASLGARLKAREEQARQLEAKGFYALKPSSSPRLGQFVIKVESLGLANRWVFDAHGDEYHYRDPQRGQKFVLLKTTLQNPDKSVDPNLPDIGVYRIAGKTMTRLSTLSYEFRRWMSYGTFIGLYHDFKNDFAHTAAIPFTAAASIDEDDAKSPLAIVASRFGCLERGSKIGQPEVEYTRRYNCDSKSTLSPEDFAKGDYQVLSFINRPKGY